MYDANKLDAILAFLRLTNDNHCSLICIAFYTKDLIFQVSVKDVPIFKGVDEQTVIQMVPLLGPLDEVTKDGSSLFLDINKFSTSVYEMTMIKPPIPTATNRILMENIYTRLQRAINFNLISILSQYN